MNRYKVLHINSVCGFGSTGKIVEKLALDEEFESLVCFGRKNYFGMAKTYKFANIIDNGIGAIRTILFDNNLCICTIATKRLINKINEFNPDIIHLHNIHGYYVNIKMLFKFLKKYKKPVIWTLHDCWAITGYCPHFDYAKCEKYKYECDVCTHRFSYPFSLFKQRVKKEYIIKKELFNSIDNLMLVVPSKWSENRIKESFLNDKRTIVIYNGIEKNETIYTKNNKKFTVLAIANYWTEEKGIKELEKIIPLIDEGIDIIIVGTLNNKKEIFNKCNLIKRTNSHEELQKIYLKSDVVINPSMEDVFGLVNIEAQHYGIPVIAYKTGGIPETIDDKTGIIVEKGDYKTMAQCINSLRKNYYFNRKEIIDYANNFDINKTINMYKKTYNNLMENEK